MSQLDLNRARELFLARDTAKREALPSGEVDNVLQELGIDLEPEEHEEMQTALDPESSGVVGLAAFLEWLGGQ